MFQIHKIKIKGNAEKHIKELLSILGAKRLSSGAYATTYKVDADEVIKVFNDDRGYERYLRDLSVMEDNPYVPQIGYVLEVTGRYYERWYMVSMERLREAHSGDKVKSVLLDFRDLVRDYVGDDDYTDLHSLTRLPKALLPAAVPRSLLLVMDVLKEAEKAGFGYDLHDGNFMVRSNGDIVITDPLVY